MNIFVGNLSREATEQDLKEAFEAFGEVSKVSIIKDKFTGEAKGFAFVEMPDNAAAQAAMDKLNGTDVKGRKLNVNEAQPRTDRPQRSGPNGGGNRNGGGFGGRGGRDRY
jgi:RNA recognition motif-containing protein